MQLQNKNGSFPYRMYTFSLPYRYVSQLTNSQPNPQNTQSQKPKIQPRIKKQKNFDKISIPVYVAYPLAQYKTQCLSRKRNGREPGARGSGRVREGVRSQPLCTLCSARARLATPTEPTTPPRGGDARARAAPVSRGRDRWSGAGEVYQRRQ